MTYKTLKEVLPICSQSGSIIVLHKTLDDKNVTEDDLHMLLGKSASLVEKVEDVTAILESEIKKTKKAEQGQTKSSGVLSVLKRPAAVLKKPASMDSDEDDEDSDESSEDEDDEGSE